LSIDGALALAERRSPHPHPSYGNFFQNLGHFQSRPKNPEISPYAAAFRIQRGVTYYI
jgi:hypothetical protein